MRLTEIEGKVSAAGFTPRGAFHPAGQDGVPDLAPGRPAGTVLLVGNAGPAMWHSFSAARDPTKDRLDDWSKLVLEAVAREVGAVALFPFDRPPLPFQRWAGRAEACYQSPLDIAIHPDYGLWHAYRGAMAFVERLDLPASDQRPNPCAVCADKPCLSACPVAAFADAGYDVEACAKHIATLAGQDCMARGCRARRACPVGREFRYEPAQARFHMTSFLRARLR